MSLANSTNGNSLVIPSQAGPLRPGMRTDVAGKAIRNVILLSLPDDEYSLVRPYLELVDLPHYFVLHETGEKIQHAYFLNEGMASLVVVSRDGHSVEVGIVGREGMVGLPLIAGMHSAAFRAIMQIPGSGVRIAADILKGFLPSMTEMRTELTRYAMMHGLQVGQIAACNRLHDLDKRLARWLLMCQDRVDSESLRLTHEFLAQMLGTGRPSVSLAAGILERAGLIENLRGRMKIVNRKQLESAACECYGVIQNFNGGLGLK